VARILKAVAAEARANGIKVGVLRPITLYPFPTQEFSAPGKTARVFVVVEMEQRQMVEDVRLAVNARVRWSSSVAWAGMFRHTKRFSGSYSNRRDEFCRQCNWKRSG